MYNKQLIQKVLEGKSTTAEEKEFWQYLADDNADLALLQEVMDESWKNTLNDQSVEGEGLKLEVLAVIREQLYAGRQVTHEKVIPLQKRAKRIWYSVAAAAILIIGVTTWWLTGNVSGPSLQHNANQQPAVWKKLINNDTRIKYALLPDSSGVWLHPHSMVAYAMPYKNGQRAVRLQGEAFFDVKHDAQHPFLVFTDSIATRVLGTAFNVEAYPGEATVRVSLVRGRVAVENGEQQQHQTIEVLQPGERMDYSKKDRHSNKESLKIKNIEEWTSGFFVFSNLPAKDALLRVAGRFNMQLHYAAGMTLADKRITTIFKNETVEQMLDIISFIAKCRYTVKNGVIEITR